MVKFVKTESTDERLFVFQEPHVTGGTATILITGKQIVDFMREMTANPFVCIHEEWIKEFCETYDAKLVTEELENYK
jgi:hypothetical protein